MFQPAKIWFTKCKEGIFHFVLNAMFMIFRRLFYSELIAANNNYQIAVRYKSGKGRNLKMEQHYLRNMLILKKCDSYKSCVKSHKH